MPQPYKTRINDQELVRYLLGLLPAEEAERLDEASIIDDDVAEQLRIAEDDLVDAYVRGGLAGDTLTRFESYYLSSPLRRERVAFAGRFIRAVDREGVTEGVPAPRRWIPTRLSTLAIAASLLLVACGALFLQSLRLGRGLTVAQADRTALERRAQDLEQQVADLQAANADAARQLERAQQPTTTPVPQAPPTIALVLFPQTRALGPVPAVSLPPTAASLGFDLRLESNDYQRYRVELRDPSANTAVWRSGWTAPKPSAGQPSVLVVVPTSVLKPQHYSLDLAGRRSDGEPEVVGSYAFEIVPQ